MGLIYDSLFVRPGIKKALKIIAAYNGKTLNKTVEQFLKTEIHKWSKENNVAISTKDEGIDYAN